jgi:caffeoyl-CoA O-methyltransferase
MIALTEIEAEALRREADLMDTPSTSVASYIRDLFLPPDPQLEAALQRATAAGLRSIQVPPELGRLLGILVQATGARRVLEIGTLGGYSAIHLARALPTDGRLISLEIDDRHAQVARENLAHAGLANRAEVRVGAALDLLPALSAEAPFDMAFIDADKESYPAYLDWCLRLVRPGGMIVVDNVLSRSGIVSPSADDDAGTRAIAAMNEAAARDPRLDAMIVPARDGRDGVLLAVVRAGGIS